MSKRARTERREAAREAAKIAKSRMRLASLETGGAADRPIDVTSASVIEPHASGLPCAACGAPGTRVAEHVAVTDDAGRRLRLARVVCPRCGVRREVWFRIGTTLPS